MSEATTHDRWTRRLLLLACAVGGLWLVGLLGHAGQAHAEVLRPVTTRRAPSAPAVAARAPIAAAAPVVSAIVEKTVPQPVKPAGHRVHTALNPVLAPIISPVAPVVRPVVSPVVHKVVEPIVAPVLHRVVEPIIVPVLGVIEPVLAPIVPITGTPVPSPIDDLPVTARPVGHPVASSAVAGHPADPSLASVLTGSSIGQHTVTSSARSGSARRPSVPNTPAAPVTTLADAARIQHAVLPATPYPAPQPMPLPAPVASPAGSTANSAHPFNGTFALTSGGGLARIGSGSLRVHPDSLLAPRDQAYRPSVSPD